jgi:tetratricopeptide (TPR) repeat protein
MKNKAQYFYLLILFLSSCNENNNRPSGLPQTDQASTVSNNTTEIIRSQSSDLAHERCINLHMLAQQQSKESNIQQSITSDSLALEIAESNGFKKEAIEILKTLETKYALQLNMFQASRLNNKGLKLAQELNDKKAEADFYSAIARGYFFSQDFESALKYHFISLNISKEIKYDFGISSALVDIGSDYQSLKKYDLAIKYYMDSRQYISSLNGTIYEAAIYQTVAVAYILMKNNDSAYKYAAKAYQVAKKQNNTHGIASTASTLGSIKLETGDVKEAKKLAFESLESIKRVNFIAQYPVTLLLVKDVLIREKKFEEALKYHEKYTTITDSLSKDKTMKLEYEKEFSLKMQNSENKNLELAHKVSILNLTISQNRQTFIVILIFILAIFQIGYLLFRQAKIKSDNMRISANQKLLRAQMNPHFIFNSLNSIKYFINVDKKEQADAYLTTFSKLVRNMLESSIEDSHNLKEEAEMLKNYLEIEALRFNSVFNYEIIIDDKLKQYNPHIPQLMVQPFVENAIWHGLLSKKGDKVLTVSFLFNSSDKITCVIDDNGIGRKASEGIRNTAKKQLAVEFAKQRINLLRKSHKIDCKLTITDKYDEAQNAAGTTVFIELPVLRYKSR